MEKDFKFKLLNGDTTFKEAIMENLMNVFGENIFAENNLKKRVPKDVFKEFKESFVRPWLFVERVFLIHFHLKFD